MELLANWLWQGSVVALAATAMLRAFEGLTGLTAKARYRVYGAALLAVMALPLLSLIPAGVSPVPESGRFAPAVAAPVALPDVWWTSNTIVVIAMAIWAAMLGGRVALEAFALGRVRRQCRAFPIARASRLRHWTRAREGGRAAQLMTSEHVGAAAVLSGRPPLIAVADPLLDRLTDGELDCVVIHEWAHVQRRDDVANTFQVAARTIAGWHPAVWWLDRRLQAEREAACDEMAAALTGSTRAYAACLVKLHELPHGGDAPLPALGMSSSSLTARIERLLSGKPSSRWSTHAALALIAVVATVSIAAGSMDLVDRIALLPVSHARPTPASIAVVEADADTPLPAVETPAVRRSAPRRVVRPSDRAESGAAQAPPSSPSSSIASESARPAPALEAISRSDRPPAPFDAPPPGPLALAVAAPGAAPVDKPPSSPWEAAAGAGTAIGRGSKKAGLATAGFFTRVGKGIAASVSNGSDARPSR